MAAAVSAAVLRPTSPLQHDCNDGGWGHIEEHLACRCDGCGGGQPLCFGQMFCGRTNGVGVHGGLLNAALIPPCT